MQLRRSSETYWAGLRGRTLGAFKRAWEWQRSFSRVSALGAFATLASFLVAALVSTTEAVRTWSISLSVVFGLMTVAPLLLGKKMPRWAGLVGVGCFAVWSVIFITREGYGRTDIMPLLQVPVVALYLGWFYPRRVSRTVMVAYLLVIVAAATFRLYTTEVDDTSSIIVPVIYSALIAGFCLETGSFRRRQAEQRALRDPLTGVYNRRGLEIIGAKLLANSLESKQQVTLAAADFDDFKAVNDAGGHAAGDDALCATSQGWVQGLGSLDLVARTGGDEFVLLIHGDQSYADALLARIRSEAKHSWSWGLAEAHPGETLQSLMIRADSELYKMKRQCQAERDA